MEPSIMLSIAAIAISLFSIGWQLRRAWWDRPVVLVSGYMKVRGVPENTGYHYEMILTIANVGERPVTLVDWGWNYGMGNHGPVNTKPPLAHPVQFPYRLEPHDRIELRGNIAFSEVSYAVRPFMTALHPNDERGPMGRAVQPFAVVVQRPKRRQIRQGVQPEHQLSGQIIPIPAENDHI